MNEGTQKLIIEIFGIDAIIGLLGLLYIISFTSSDSNLILALMTVVTTPISLLGGFITGKTMNELESETIRQELIKEYKENNEIIGYEECGDDGA